MSEKKFFPEYRIYKPRKTKDGAASKLQYSRSGSDRNLFWVSVKEIPSDGENAAFGWKDEEKAVTMKLGMADVSAMLATLTGKNAEAKLFHQNPRGSTTLTLTRDKDKGIYFLRVTGKRDENEAVQISHSVTYAEAEVLRVLLERFIAVAFAWT